MSARGGILLALAALVAVIAAIVLVGLNGGSYEVRAMFRSAFSVTPGAEVKVAGVPVGTIRRLDVENRTAVVVLNISDRAFQDFRSDATCTIRPQSLIGERYVECELTQPRAPDRRRPGPLRQIDSGPGKGQYLLPVTQTSGPVDMDLVLSTYKLPVRQRLAIILDELGVGLASNGRALRRAVRDANPTLRELERVTGILADQNRALAQIAADGDKALAPLAAQRKRVAAAVGSINAAAQATAERAPELEQTVAKLPAALRELRPAMRRLEKLAGAAEPVAADIDRSAADINRLIAGLGEVARVGGSAFGELGETATLGRETLVRSEPLLRETRTLARAVGRPLKDGAGLLSSLQRSGGMESLMDTIYFMAASMNGYDQSGHYLRATPIINSCLSYTAESAVSCTSKFFKDQNRTNNGSASATGKEGPVVARNNDGSRAARREPQAGAIELPSAILPGFGGGDKGSAATGKPEATDGGGAAILDYLMGG